MQIKIIRLFKTFFANPTTNYDTKRFQPVLWRVFVPATYIISSQDGQMEGQELQGDDTEDALQTVHSMWQLNGLVGILNHVGVILATEHDRPALEEAETRSSSSAVFQSTSPCPGESVSMPTCFCFILSPIWL